MGVVTVAKIFICFADYRFDFIFERSRRNQTSDSPAGAHLS
jgi:hypothetical protein